MPVRACTCAEIGHRTAERPVDDCACTVVEYETTRQGPNDTHEGHSSKPKQTRLRRLFDDVPGAALLASRGISQQSIQQSHSANCAIVAFLNSPGLELSHS